MKYMSLVSRIRERLNFQDTSPKTKIQPEHNYYPKNERQHTDFKLDRIQLGNIVASEPMIRKGIWKENKDIFGEGWQVQHKEQDMTVDETDLELINVFDKKANTKYKLEQAGISANIYGDGFLELIFEEPDGTPINTPVPPDMPPVDLSVFKAEYISKTKPVKGVEYYVYKDKQEKLIHPDRIIHIVKKRLPGHLFGISDVFTCGRVLTSMMNADIYFGEFIEWAGKGVFNVTLKGVTESELADAQQKIKRSNVQLHDENATWEVLNPVTMSPAEYYDYFFIKVAATLDMPQHILTGVQPGQLTGSEIGLADYYKNITNIQELVFTPILEKIYTLLLQGNGRSFEDYEIRWNPIYVDEQSEANILLSRTNAAAMAHDRFIIDDDEYRMIMKEGIQDLAGTSTLKEDVDIEQPETPVEDILPEEKIKTDAEQLRIMREKRIGELELILQEKRVKDAKTKTI
uniref:Anti-CBASS protein Acb1-like N-terminal domain-containing protein n=1 Tax=viral metagenome TaxID=1070528 RepID=A0A6M3KYV7_9ZZZZ